MMPLRINCLMTSTGFWSVNSASCLTERVWGKTSTRDGPRRPSRFARDGRDRVSTAVLLPSEVILFLHWGVTWLLVAGRNSTEVPCPGLIKKCAGFGLGPLYGDLVPNNW